MHDARKHAFFTQLKLTDRQPKREYAAIFFPARHLAPNAYYFTIACCQIIEHIAIMIMLVRIWHQHGHILTHHLPLSIAEYFTPRRIYWLNNTPFVDGNNAINSRFDDGL